MIRIFEQSPRGMRELDSFLNNESDTKVNVHMIEFNVAMPSFNDYGGHPMPSLKVVVIYDEESSQDETSEEDISPENEAGMDEVQTSSEQ